MFPQFGFNESEMLAFVLVLLRMASFLVSWPVFSVFSVPNHAKILLAMLITVLVFPVVDRSQLVGAGWSNEIVWLALKEVSVGLFLGFLTRFFFFAISIAGDSIATSMGLSNAHIFNPTISAQSTTVEQFFVVISTLLFLSVNGHHVFLQGIVESFDLIPLSLKGINPARFGDFGRDMQLIVSTGLRLSAPIVVSIFLMNIALGILGRTVPQINVLVTSMPVNIAVGLGVTMLMLPLFVMEMGSIVNEMAGELFLFMKGI